MNAPLLSRSFLLFCGQLVALSIIAALFFPLQLYLESLGVSPAASGFILGADALAGLVVLTCLTPVVTPRSARRWLVAGALTLAVAMLAEGSVTGTAWFAAARLLQGAGFAAVVTALTVLAVLAIPPARSGQAFGLLSLMRLVPYAVVPLLFDLGGVAPADLGRVILWATSVALVPLGLLLFIPRFAQEREQSRPPGLAGVRRSLGEPNLRLLLAASLAVYAAHAVTFFFLKGFAREMGFGGAGLFFTIAMLMMIATRLAGAALFDRYRKSGLALGALMLVALATLALACGPAGPIWYLLAAGCGLGWGVALPLLNALGFVLSRPDDRGLNQNLLFLTIQGGFFLGPLLAGGIVAWLGFRGLFAAAAATNVAAALLVWPLLRVEPAPGRAR
jgi:MFS family permease